MTDYMEAQSYLINFGQGLKTAHYACDPADGVCHFITHYLIGPHASLASSQVK